MAGDGKAYGLLDHWRWPVKDSLLRWDLSQVAFHFRGQEGHHGPGGHTQPEELWVNLVQGVIERVVVVGATLK